MKEKERALKVDRGGKTTGTTLRLIDNFSLATMEVRGMLSLKKLRNS